MGLEHIPTDMHCNGRAARMSVLAMILGKGSDWTFCETDYAR